MKKEYEKSRVKNYSRAEIFRPLSSNTELQEIEKCELIDNDHFSITEQIPIITEPKIKLGEIKCEKLKSNEVESTKPVANSSAYEVIDLSSDDGSIDFETGTLNHTLYDLKFNKTIPGANNCSSQSSISINHSKYQMDSKCSKDIENHLVIGEGSSVKKISKVLNKRSLFSSDNNYYKDVKLSDGIHTNAEANTSKTNIEQKNALPEKSFIFTQNKIGDYLHENSHLKSKQQASRKYQNSQKMPKETTDLNNLKDSLKSKLKEFNVLDVTVLLPSNVSKNGKLLWSLKKQRPSCLTNVGNLSGTETHSLNKEERYNLPPEYLNKFNEDNYSPTTNLLNKSFDEKPKTTNIDTAKNNGSNLCPSSVSLENINSNDFERPLNEHIDLQKYGNIVYNHVLCDPLSSVSLKNLSQNEKGEFCKVNCKLPLVSKPFSCSPSTKEPVQEISINNVHMVSNNLLSESASQSTYEMINQLHFSKSILTNTIKQFSPITVYSHLPITKSCIHSSLRCTNSEANINKCENKNLFENTDKTYTHENFTLHEDSLYHQKNSSKRSPNFSSINYEDSHLHSYELAPPPKSKTFRPKLLPKSSSNSSLSFLINNSGTELNRYHLNQEKYKFSKMNKEYVEKIELSDSDITTITVSSYSSDDDEKSNTVIHSSDDYTTHSVIHISSDSEEDVKRLCPEKESMHGLFLLNNLKKNNESETTSVSLYEHGIFQEGLSDEEDESRFDLSRRRRRKTASNKRLESFVHTPVLPTLIKVLNEDKTTPEKHPRSISIRQMKKLSKSLNLKSFHIVLEKLSPVVIKRVIDLCKNKSNWGEKECLSKAGLTAYDIDRMRLTALRQQGINTYSLRRFMKKNIVFQSSMNSPSKATKRTEIRHLQLIKTSKKRLKEEALAKLQKDFKEKNIASIRRALLKINCRYKNQSRFWLHLDRLCSSHEST